MNTEYHLTRYKAKNAAARAILDQRTHRYWLAYEIGHIRRQLSPKNREEFDREITIDSFHPDALEWDYWHDECLKPGSHEIVLLLDRMAQILPIRYHRYLHYGLTSSNVIDAVNHIKWRQLYFAHVRTVGNMYESLCDKQDIDNIIGMTHGRKASHTTFRHRFSSVIAAIPYLKPNQLNLMLPDRVMGGPTGAADAAQAGRQCIFRANYWPLWTYLAQYAAAIEQIATDYRFYASDFNCGISVSLEHPTSSSSMPDKRNPSELERICGLAIGIRQKVSGLMILPAQWLDRDLVHSSTEREVIPVLWEHSFYIAEQLTTIIRSSSLHRTIVPPVDDSHERLLFRQRLGLHWKDARVESKG